MCQRGNQHPRGDISQAGDTHPAGSRLAAMLRSCVAAAVPRMFLLGRTRLAGDRGRYTPCLGPRRAEASQWQLAVPRRVEFVASSRSNRVERGHIPLCKVVLIPDDSLIDGVPLDRLTPSLHDQLTNLFDRQMLGRGSPGVVIN